MSNDNLTIKRSYLQTTNFEVIRGDTFTIKLRVYINNEVMMLPEDGQLTFMLYSPFSIKIKHYTRATQNENGYFIIHLTPDETQLLVPNEHYKYEIECLLNNQTIYTILKGYINIIPDNINALNRKESYSAE